MLESDEEWEGEEVVEARVGEVMAGLRLDCEVNMSRGKVGMCRKKRPRVSHK
jgi:hypothetical protein